MHWNCVYAGIFHSLLARNYYHLALCSAALCGLALSNDGRHILCINDVEIVFSFNILTYLYVPQKVPETPIWLLSKKRDAEALRSLQWLRGWVSPKAVEFEFNDLKRYHETSDSCVACYKASVKCCHPPPGLRERIREIPRKRTMRPFAIIVFCFLVAQFNGLIPIRAYLIQILKAFAIPIDANLATVIVGAMQFLGNIVCMTLIKVLGKRRLFFISLSGSALCCFGLGMSLK